MTFVIWSLTRYLVHERIVCIGNLFLFISAKWQPPLEQLHLNKTSAVDAAQMSPLASHKDVAHYLYITRGALEYTAG